MKPLAISFLLLAGCASYTHKPLDPRIEQTAFETRRLEDPEMQRYLENMLGHQVSPWPPSSWDLTTLTLAALRFHPDLGTAQAATVLARAGIITAGARPNPTAAISVQHSSDSSGSMSPWIFGAGVEIPIETAGKRGFRVEQAEHLAEAARWREIDTVWQVRSRVRASLLAVYPTDSLLRRQRDVQEEVVRLLERRLAAGYASQPEVAQARLALNQATLAVAENQKVTAENFARLAAAVGVPLSALNGRNVTHDGFEIAAPATLPPATIQRDALLGRPDVFAALAEYQASQSALQLEIAKQYPDVSLGPGYTWDQGAVKWALGLSLVLPVLNRNEGPIAEAEARRKAAAAAFLSTQAKVIAELDEARSAYEHDVRMIEIADAILREQQNKELAAATAFQAGEVDRLSWVSARYETVTAELARINAWSHAQQSLGRLQDATRLPIGDVRPLASAAENAMSSPISSGEQP